MSWSCYSFKKKYYIHYSTNEHFFFLILLLKAWDQTWAALPWWFCFGAAWLISTVRISSTIPPSWPSYAASYGILLVLPNLKCERERERELKRAESVCPRGFTWVWCPWRSVWPFPWQHRHDRVGDIPCHPWACPQSYGKSSFNSVICILSQLCLPPKHSHAVLWLWGRLRNTKKGSHWVTSFSAASKLVFSHHSVSSCPSEYRSKWRLKPIIFTNIWGKKSCWSKHREFSKECPKMDLHRYERFAGSQENREYNSCAVAVLCSCAWSDTAYPPERKTNKKYM